MVNKSVPNPRIKEDLLECLSNLEPSGSTKPFAVFNALKSPPNPGLLLKLGTIYEPIGLPLSNGDAKLFRRAADAVYDKDEKGEKILDVNGIPSARVWEIPAKNFTIQNPAWEPFLRNILKKVSAGLGVDSTGKGVSAELCKISLHEGGDTSKPYPSSDMISTTTGMFGTLVIALPSKHEGGDIHISGGAKVFNTSATSAFDSSYVAWFHDATNEFKPVAAGGRLMLTYSLLHDTLGPDALAANSNKGLAKLDALFSWWKDHIEDVTSEWGEKLAYVLNIDYSSDNSLTYNTLNGPDLELARSLRDACNKYGFYIYLADLRRTIETNEEYDDDRFGYERELDQDEAESSLSRVVELDGTEIAKDMCFNDDALIQEGYFEGVEPDAEDYLENVVFYRRTLILIMPKANRLDWLATPVRQQVVGNYCGGTTKKGKAYVPDIIGWIERLFARLSTEPDNSNDRQDLEGVCKKVVKMTGDWKARHTPEDPPPFSDKEVARVISACVELDWDKFFVEAFEVCPDDVPSSMFRSVGAALLRWDLKSLLPKISQHMSRLNELSSRFDIINEIKQGITDESQKFDHTDAPYQEWIIEEADNAISNTAISITSAKDGVILANQCERLEREDVFDKILPAVKRNIKHTSMTLAFQHAIYQAATEGNVPLDVVRAIFSDVVSDMLNGFSLQALGAVILVDTSKDSTRFLFYGRDQPPPAPLLKAERSRGIALLLSHYQSLDLSTELSIIVSNLAEEAKAASLEFVERIFLAFLKILGSVIQEQGVSVQDSPFPALFQQVFSNYIERYVQEPPEPYQGWSRPPIFCTTTDCKDCFAVNKFLVNPHQQLAHFVMGQQRRDHIWSKVKDTGIGFEMRKKGTQWALFLEKNDAYIVKAREAWEARGAAVRTRLLDMEKDANLKDLFGYLYPTIMSGTIPGSSSANVQAPGFYASYPSMSGFIGLHASRQLPPLGAGAGNMQLPPLSSIIHPSQDGGSLVPLASGVNAANRILPPGPRGIKRKASSEIIVIDD